MASLCLEGFAEWKSNCNGVGECYAQDYEEKQAMHRELDFPYACVLSIGDLSSSLIDCMKIGDKGDGIRFLDLKEFYLQPCEEMQKSHLLFIIFDSSIGEEVNLTLELADQARAAEILTMGICWVGNPIVSGTDQRWQILEQVRANMDSLAIVATTKDPSHRFQEHDKETPDSIVRKIARECQSIVHSLSYIFSHESFVGIDFEDVREALSGSGYAAIGVGDAQGDDRGVTACANAIEDLTNKGIDLRDVRGVSVKISGHYPSLNDFSDVMEHLESLFAEDCRVVVAAYWNDAVDDESLNVSLLVSGLTRESVGPLAELSARLERKAS